MTLSPQMTLWAMAEFVPQMTLVPQVTLFPERTLTPQMTLVPQVTDVPQVTLFPVTRLTVPEAFIDTVGESDLKPLGGVL